MTHPISTMLTRLGSPYSDHLYYFDDLLACLDPEQEYFFMGSHVRWAVLKNMKYEENWDYHETWGDRCGAKQLIRYKNGKKEQGLHVWYRTAEKKEMISYLILQLTPEEQSLLQPTYSTGPSHAALCDATITVARLTMTEEDLLV
jgi:hypothetical protein